MMSLTKSHPEHFPLENGFLNFFLFFLKPVMLENREPCLSRFFSKIKKNKEKPV